MVSVARHNIRDGLFSVAQKTVSRHFYGKRRMNRSYIGFMGKDFKSTYNLKTVGGLKTSVGVGIR